MVREVDFIRLHLGPLAESVQENANAWVTSLGKLLNNSARDNLEGLKNTIDQLENDLERSPDTLEDLKFVLKTISNIQDLTLEVETRAKDIKERFVVRTYTFYNTTNKMCGEM